MMEDNIGSPSSYSDSSYSPYFSSYGQDNRVGLAKELSPDAPLLDVVERLRGRVKNPDTQKYDIEIQRSMNEQGVSIFTMIATSGANDINTKSNYRTDDKIIYKLIQKFILDAVYIFYYERGKFIYHEEELEDGTIKKIPTLIQDEAYVSVIINLLAGLLLASFFKALGAGDRGAVTKSVSEMIQRAVRDEQLDNQAPKRRGFLSKVNPFGH